MDKYGLVFVYRKLHKKIGNFNNPIAEGWLDILESTYFWVCAMTNKETEIEFDIDLAYFWWILSGK